MTLIMNNFSADVRNEREAREVYALQHAPKGVYRSFVKRALDIALVMLAAPVAFTIIGLTALAVMLDGHSPFYTQQRVGKGGKTFRIWKLRTMVVDADRFLADYLARNPGAKLEWDATQKLKRDPRITKVGRVLRKLSIDELPQLFNVLNGTMSLVGPRPMMVNQKHLYHGTAYYNMRPGITGLWQVSDRNECEFVGRVGYDEEYYRELSFSTDLDILMKTVTVVLRGTGY